MLYGMIQNINSALQPKRILDCCLIKQEAERRQNEKNRVIALTGGVGSGKSRILELLEQEYHAEVIQADLVAKELEEPGQPGLKALIRAFGQEITGENGCLKRDVLAAMIFGDEKIREEVNRLIHPLVWEKVKKQVKESLSPIVVVESAILPENPDDFFDEVWYVYTLRECRIHRLMESRGYSRERCLRMMEGQASEEEFRKMATYVIDNNGSMEDVGRQVAKMMNSLFKT